MRLFTRFTIWVIMMFLLLGTSTIVSSLQDEAQRDLLADNTGLQPDNIVNVGKGSYTETLPVRNGPPTDVYITSNFEGPLPSNDWLSSVLVGQYSHPIYTHPVSYKAIETGLEVGYPFNAGGGSFLHRADLVVGSSDFNPVDARLDAASDWFADIKMANGDDYLMASIGHGSPFAYFELNNGDATFSFSGPITVYSNQGSYIGLTTSFGNHFGLFAPTGSSWTGATTGSNVVTLTLGSSYFSVASLPDNDEATLDYYAELAFAFIVDTQVQWEYNGNGAVINSYDVTTEAREGDNLDTILTLYPHQWRDQDITYLTYSYDSVRGELKTIEGRSFQTTYSYSGILPMLPDQSNFDHELLSDLVSESAPMTYDPFRTDTYWRGKEMGRLAQLLPVAEQIG
ncbi:MAG: hypothetical protein ACXAE3_15270, partial [Candidatus Kariarchaeaceae archaeon]